MILHETLRRRLVAALLLPVLALAAVACTSADATGPATTTARPTPKATAPTRSGPGFTGDRSTLKMVPDDVVPAGCRWIPSTASLECRGKAVLKDVYVRGGIDAYAGITISNSVIAATSSNWLLLNLRAIGGRCSVTHSTLTYANGGHLPVGFTTWGVGGINDMGGCRGVYTDNDISGTPDGIDTGADGTVIKGNYVHDLATLGVYPKNTHNDGVQLYGCSSCKITGNRFDLGWDGTHQNSCFFAANGQTGKNILFSGNYLSGGGYAFRNMIGTNMTVTDNTFRALPKQYGLALTGPRASFASWTGNVTTSGKPVPQPRP